MRPGRGRRSKDGVYSHNGQSLTFKELAAKIAEHQRDPVVGRASVAPEGSTNAFGVHIADVEVDPETGKVTILRYTAIQDAGKAVHPSYVEGQMQGGAVQGIGWALNEEYFFDAKDQMRNASFLDYRMPTCLDVPMIETIIVEVPNPAHPFGVRGVGETPIVAPARHDRQRHPRGHRRPHDRAADVAAGALEGARREGLNPRESAHARRLHPHADARPDRRRAREVAVEGGTVREVVDALDRQFPGIKERLCRGDALAPGLQVCDRRRHDHARPAGDAAARERGPFPAGDRRRLSDSMHYLLFYDVVADYAERRKAFRKEHLALARAAHARGELVLGGALADPVDGAVLLFRGDSPAVAEAFAAADPYVQNGLVTRWRVREWTTVVGDGAAVFGSGSSSRKFDPEPVHGIPLIMEAMRMRAGTSPVSRRIQGYRADADE